MTTRPKRWAVDSYQGASQVRGVEDTTSVGSAPVNGALSRRIGVASKAELKRRIMADPDDLNPEPAVHTWSYRTTLSAR